MRTIKPGADSNTLRTIRCAAYGVEEGANHAELGFFPIKLYISDFDEKDNLLEDYDSICNNLEEFVVSASDLLDILDRVLLKQKIQVANAAPR